MPKIKTSRKVHKEKVKRIRAGWKKKDGVYVYQFKKSVSEKYKIKTIEFYGFKERPVGLFLYESGGGFNMNQSNKFGGNFILDFLKQEYGKWIKLKLHKSLPNPSFRALKLRLIVNMTINDFSSIAKDLGNEIKEKKRLIIEKRLAKFFPSEFQTVGTESINKKLAEISLKDLSEADHGAVVDFVKNYLNLNAGEIPANLQAQLVIQGQKKTLNNVIEKFEKYMEEEEGDEKKWQKFLHAEVFFFMTSYVESIREANVNIGKVEEGAKKPDFVWIDTYGFLDVFEIKTPGVAILARRIDGSHKNYYFSADASKAISQIEKYILFLEKNVDEFKKYLTKKTSIPFSVLKPKAFLIIGNSKQLNNPEKKRDFRLLRRLFKNIEFITFDELLDNLKNLAKKFDKK